MMIVKIAKSIQDVSLRQWNAITRGPFFSHEWFQCMEASERHRHQFFYFLVTEGERLIGAIPTFVPLHASDIYRNFLYGRLRPFITSLPGGRARPLICHCLGASGKNLFSDQDFLPHILPLLVRAVQDISTQENFSDFVFLLVRKNERMLIETLESMNFSKVYLSAAAILQNRFRTFDDYLCALSRNGKKTVKGDLRRFTKYGCVASICDRPEAEIPAISKLVANINKKYKSTLTKHSQNTLQMISRLMAPYQTTYLVRARGETIGTISLFIKDNLISTHAGGLDYASVKDSGAYFNLFYYLPIREMIRHRAPYLNFNHMAYRVKESRGAKLIPQYMFVKSLKPNRAKQYWFNIVNRRYRDKFQKEYTREMNKKMRTVTSRQR